MPAPHETPAPPPGATAASPESVAPSPTAAHEARLLAARQAGQPADTGAALMALAGEHSRLARDDLALPLWEEASRLANTHGDPRLGREAALAAADAYQRRGDRALEQTWREQADAYRERIANGIAPPPPAVAVPAPASVALPEAAAAPAATPPAPEPPAPSRWPWLLVPLALALLWAWRRSQHKAERLHEEAERLARHQRQLRTANSALQEQAAQLRQAAVQDALTGALSRTAFARQLEETLLHAAHYGKPVALMVFDLDHFKAINDSHGHLAGDAALRYVAGIVRENLRSEDLFGRFGGDEFLIGAADLDRGQALALAENIRSAAHLRAAGEDPRLAALSLSLGIAHADPGAGYSLELLFSRADAALYAAKRSGRNRSVLEDPSTPAPPRDQHAPRSLAPAP
jgi:diguanylate cyclase (GGDEF)-like protein